METNEKMKDELLWKVAKKRVSFKRGLIAYVVVNAFLWGVWFFSESEATRNFIPWPAWSMFGWGIGLTFQFFGAYVFHGKMDSIEKEYSKMKTNA